MLPRPQVAQKRPINAIVSSPQVKQNVAKLLPSTTRDGKISGKISDIETIDSIFENIYDTSFDVSQDIRSKKGRLTSPSLHHHDEQASVVPGADSYDHNSDRNEEIKPKKSTTVAKSRQKAAKSRLSENDLSNMTEDELLNKAIQESLREYQIHQEKIQSKDKPSGSDSSRSKKVLIRKSVKSPGEETYSQSIVNTAKSSVDEIIETNRSFADTIVKNLLQSSRSGRNVSKVSDKLKDEEDPENYPSLKQNQRPQIDSGDDISSKRRKCRSYISDSKEEDDNNSEKLPCRVGQLFDGLDSDYDEEEALRLAIIASKRSATASKTQRSTSSSSSSSSSSSTTKNPTKEATETQPSSSLPHQKPSKNVSFCRNNASLSRVYSLPVGHSFAVPPHCRYDGVYAFKHRYRAYIEIQGTIKLVPGLFDSTIEAAMARDEMLKMFKGDESACNFVSDPTANIGQKSKSRRKSTPSKNDQLPFYGYSLTRRATSTKTSVSIDAEISPSEKIATSKSWWWEDLLDNYNQYSNRDI